MISRRGAKPGFFIRERISPAALFPTAERFWEIKVGFTYKSLSLGISPKDTVINKRKFHPLKWKMEKYNPRMF
jgi:hypothetical protein